MTGIEITLLILGAIIFAASFIIPEMKKEPSKEQQKLSEAEIKKVIDREMEHVRDRVDEVVDETIDYTMEKTERSLSKISNEKIIAVNEYSDTVLAEINKSHKEVMFLYDMLNDKQTDLKNAVRKAEATKEEAVAAAAEAAIPIQESVVVKEVPKTVRKGTAAKKQSVEHTVERSTRTSGGIKNNNQLILGMHRDGKSNIEIAKELGLGLGEVKLVIDLFEGA